jgi:hypothetical protein
MFIFFRFMMLEVSINVISSLLAIAGLGVPVTFTWTRRDICMCRILRRKI